MNLPHQSIDPSIQIILEHLPPTPIRNPQVASHGRAQFLTEAQLLHQPVSPRPAVRQGSWLDLFQRKERMSMSTIVLVLAVISLVLGGSGATVVAAQEAMPNDPLYGIKLATEDVQIQATNNTQTRIELEFVFANRRTNEIVGMANEGVVPPTQIMNRQQSETEAAFHEAASLDDAAMRQVLLRTQTMLRDQLQITDQARSQASDQVMPTLDRVHEQLRLQLDLTDLGLRDPQQFRIQVHQTKQERSLSQPTAQPQPTVPPQPTAAQQQQQQQRPTAQPQITVQPQPTAQPQPTVAQQQQQEQQQQQKSSGSSTLNSNQSGKR